MAKRKNLTHQDTNDTLANEVFSAILFTIGLFSFLSLIFYSSKSGYDLKNTMGSIGVFISGILGQSFGVTSFFIPVVMFYAAYIVFTNNPGIKLYRRTISCFIFVISLTTLIGLIFSDQFLGYNPAGGWIGVVLSSSIKDFFAGTVGSYIIVTIFLLLSLILVTEVKIARIFNLVKEITMYTSETASNAGKNIFNWISLVINQRYNPPISESKNNNKIMFDEKEFFNTEDDESSGPEIVFETGHDDIASSKVINLPLKRDFTLPSSELLDPKIDKEIKVDKDVVYHKAKLIEEKLRDFGVSGKITEIRPGPVITMFEYKPAPGIKINKIASLENDLAMGLSALSIRIVAPIPGKNVIGIEVPNHECETVMIRELIEDSNFMDKSSVLTLALGKDISGKPFYSDLRKAPHLMIAGTTGSGKSVLLNAILTSLVYKSTPHELKFIMIDPKMLELSIYENIPHLLHPVVTEPLKAAAALKWAVIEMDERYRLLSEEGVRDLETYNQKIELEDSEDKWDKWMPYIVIVIDELADLMMVAPSEIKESITRLSQKARAAGIHLIVATQRPSVDIVAGLLKANFPARISFHVSSKIDSRIILDTGGAESLLGKGDMLFLKPGTSSLIRIQGALISDLERKRITEHLKSQGQPDYNEKITYIEEKEDNGEIDDEKDELYDTALRLIAETKQASISMLQRRLKIGYNRAANIVETMEREGVIGPQESAGKPREVYIDINQIRGLGFESDS
ncbi:MAG: DNA translocase FtsK [Thermodesulfobacteriota bacterium]